MDMKLTKSWLAAALVAAFVAGGARVGKGLEYNKKTNPHEITLRLVCSEGNFTQHSEEWHQKWQKWFDDASAAIWKYTDYQAYIKEVKVWTEAVQSAPENPDVKIVGDSRKAGDWAWPKAHVYVPGGWFSGWFSEEQEGFVTLPSNLDELTFKLDGRPRKKVPGKTIAHELGHYVYGVSDEYGGPCYSTDSRGKKTFYTINGVAADKYDYKTSPVFIGSSSFFSGTPSDSHALWPVDIPSIMGDESESRHDRMSRATDAFTKKWTGWGGILPLTMETHQYYRTDGKSGWETMVENRGLRMLDNAVEPGYRPYVEWTIMDGPFVMVLLVDSSGSMDGAPMQEALQAARHAVGVAHIREENKTGNADDDEFITGDYVGVIFFDSGTATLVPLQEMKDKQTRSGAQAAIARRASGGTYINRALNAALDSIQNTIGLTARGPEYILLLSDGMSQDTVTDATLDALRKRGVKVNTVAFGNNADKELLQRIATKTGGWHCSEDISTTRAAKPNARLQSSSVASSLDQLFAEMYYDGRESEQLARLEGVLNGGTMENEFVVDSYVDINLTVNLYWTEGDMDLALVRPDGTVIERAAAEAAVSELDGGKASDSAFIRVSSPEAGTWKVRVTPEEGNGEQAYLAMVSGTGRDNMRLFVESSGDSLTWPTPLMVAACFGGPVPAITGAVVTAVATCPGGAEVPFELYDDGKHEDGEAGDGVYAAEFTQFTEDGEYRFDVEGKNVSGKTSWQGYSPSLGGDLPEPEPVEPFVRRKSLTVQYDGVPEFINATRYTGTEFANWTLNRNTGAMTGSLVVSNQPSSRKTLIAPFWYAVTETVNVCLAKVDGYTDDGDPYVNITDKVEAALMAKYGRKSMAPGEWVAIDGVEVYSRDRSIPDMTALWSLWADPPAGAERRVDSYDHNANGVLDDEEILLAVEHWEALDMDDEALLKRIDLWKQGEE